MIETFDPKDLLVSVGGLLLTGFASRMITVERDTHTVKDERGVEGEVTRYLSEDRRGLLTFTLLPYSPSNLGLSALINLDEITGATVFSVVIKDGRGLDVVVAPVCWLRGHAKIDWSNGVDNRVWNVRSSSIRIVQGRNLFA